MSTLRTGNWYGGREYDIAHQKNLPNCSREVYLEKQPDIITKFENLVIQNTRFKNRHKFKNIMCVFHQVVISKSEIGIFLKKYAHFILGCVKLI